MNYQHKLGICPPKCNANANVFGRSLYHPESPVCAAAILDNSIPVSGGLIGMALKPPQKKYESYVRTRGIEIKSKEGGTAYSGSTFKVINPDFSQKDVRILNKDGVPSH